MILNQQERQDLSDVLFGVAQAYFTGGPVYTGCGICAATEKYDEMRALMRELGEPYGVYGNGYAPYTSTRGQWEPRAWMCLFLYTYLISEE
jgi:hypothetical protein